MPELSLSQCVPLPPPPPRESDELAMAIARETALALNDDEAWYQAHADVAALPQGRELMRTARAGADDLEVGWRLVQTIRRQVIQNATEKARDEFAEAQDGAA